MAQKTLTQTEYQSLPVNEQSNWKEQWEAKDQSENWFVTKCQPNNTKAGKDFIDFESLTYFLGGLDNTRLIYIPINPESVLNAEMGETVVTQSRLRNLINRFENGDYNITDVILRAYDEGKLDRSSDMIDIVEAEIKYWGYQPHLNGKQSLIRVLTKLKEIK